MIRKATFLLIVFWFCATIVMAQPGGGGPDTPPDVPITGIEILIGLGGALGLRKLFLANKRKPSEK